LKDRVTVG